jgi:nucleotide-binding universal stress UspA family protein
LSGGLSGELTILHAQRWEFPLYFTAAQTRELEAQLRKSDEVAQKYLEEFADRNMPKGIPRANRLVEDEPVEAILRSVRETAADLMVMGTHGRTGWSRFRLGSVMEGVLRQAPVSVLGVGPGATSADPSVVLHSVLCPVNFNVLSRSTLEIATFLARETGAQLTVLHVLEGKPGVAESSVKAAKERLCEWVRAAGGDECAFRQIVRHGDPVEAILEEEKRKGCGLLVIGAKPRLTLSSILFGTTTEELIRNAPCPVLLVPARKIEV